MKNAGMKYSEGHKAKATDIRHFLFLDKRNLFLEHKQYFIAKRFSIWLSFQGQNNGPEKPVLMVQGGNIDFGQEKQRSHGIYKRSVAVFKNVSFQVISSCVRLSSTIHNFERKRRYLKDPSWKPS